MRSLPTPIPSRDPRYLRLLLVLLGTTTFFEGYDAAIPAVVLRDLANAFGSSRGTLGWAIFAVGLGAFGSLFITALGDRIGRRPLLIGTTLAYALFTGLTATAHSVLSFVAFQFFAKAFLISELATAITMVAEEFPAERRGRAIGILSAMGALGIVAVAAAYPLLARTTLGWRGLYLIGVLPLLLVGILRVKLRETHRFLVSRQEGTRTERVPFRQVLAGNWRRELVMMSAVFFLSHFALLAAMTWWSTYVQDERDFTTDEMSTFLAIAYVLGLIGYFVAGRLQDRVGRRVTGSGFMLAGLGFGILLFQVHDRSVMFLVMVLAIFFGVGVAPVINALAPELFPTEIRATAVAFIRSVFGTLGGILGPLVVGQLADQTHGLIGNIGDSVSLVALAYIPAAIILWRLPETAGRELESIAGTGAPASTDPNPPTSTGSPLADGSGHLRPGTKSRDGPQG